MSGSADARSTARAHAVAVVDDEEDDRQVPERGEVERLVPGAHVHRAVAELADHGLLLAATDHGEREAGGDRQLAGDDAPAAVEAAVDVEQVHRAAAAVRAAVGAAEQLRHHRLRRYPAGEREAVTAITGDELVVVLHRVDHADGRRLLAGGEVAVAADLGGLVLALGLGLEHADQHHLLVQPAQVGRREGRRGVHRASRDLLRFEVVGVLGADRRERREHHPQVVAQRVLGGVGVVVGDRRRPPCGARRSSPSGSRARAG